MEPDDRTDESLSDFQSRRKFEAMMRKNNPHNEPTGDHTGRCWRCGSRNVWTDHLAYGCDDCGMIRCG